MRMVSGFSPFISFTPEYPPGTGSKVHFRKLCTNSSPSTSGVPKCCFTGNLTFFCYRHRTKPGDFQHSCSMGVIWSTLGFLHSCPSLLLALFFIDMNITPTLLLTPHQPISYASLHHTPLQNSNHINSPCGTESAGKPEIRYIRRQRKKFTYNFWGL